MTTNDEIEKVEALSKHLPPDAVLAAAEDDGDEDVITMDKRVDLAVMVGVVILGAVMFFGAFNIKHGIIPDPIGSRGMPIATAIFLMVGGLVLIVRRLRTWRELPGNLVVEEGKADNPMYPSTWLRPAGIVALGFVWVFGLYPLGYLIVTPILLIGSVLVMGERSLGKVIVFPLVFTVASWLIFAQALKVLIPLGPLSAIARHYGLIP